MPPMVPSTISSTLECPKVLLVDSAVGVDGVMLGDATVCEFDRIEVGVEDGLEDEGAPKRVRQRPEIRGEVCVSRYT